MSLRRGRRFRRLFPRGLSFTREGRVFVLVTLGVGFAAVNTGNNLLFLVLGMLLGLIVVSGILSEITLRSVTVTRTAPPFADAGEVFPVHLALLNRKRASASFSVELRDEIEGAPFKRRCFFLRVGPGERRSIAYRCEIPKRGPATFDGTIVSTRFPFGLFEKTRFVELREGLTVFPRKVPVGLPRGTAEPGDGGDPKGLKGPGQDFLELREMVPGDDPRRMDWRATARTGQRFVRETEREARSLVEICLDASAPPDNPKRVEAAEERIRIAGSLARRYSDMGCMVRLVTSGGVAVEAEGKQGLTRLLTHLALLDVGEEAKKPRPEAKTPGAIVLAGEARGRFGEGGGKA